MFTRDAVNLYVALAMAFFGSACFAAEASLTFQRSGQAIPLDAEESQRVIQKIEAIVRSANFNSLNHPEGFDASVLRPVAEIRKDSFLNVHYSAPTTFSTIGGELIADDIWIDIRPQNPHAGLFPGPICLVNAAGITCLGKESGMLVIGLGLDPAIYPHLPHQMQVELKSAKVIEKSASATPLIGFEERGFVGVVIGTTKQVPGGDFRSILSVIPKSPAADAGIKSGDYIISVDGKSTAGMKTPFELIHALQGAPGTQIRLELKGVDSEGVDTLTITRAKQIFSVDLPK